MGFTDDMKNKAQELSGKAKEGFGKATGNEDAEMKGKFEQAGASIKQAATDAADKAKGLVNDAMDKLKGDDKDEA